MNKMENILFELSNTQLSVHHLSSNSIIASWHFDFSSKPELQRKDYVADFLVREGITLLNYSNILVLWSTNQTVLVPNKLFENTSMDSLLALSFGDKFIKNDSDYNRNHILGTVMIYTIPLWIKSLFVSKFPGAKIIHSCTAWLNYLATKNTNIKFHGVLVLAESTCSLVVFHEDKPVVFIQNTFSAVEDIIYHTTYSLQKMNLLEKKGIIEIFSFDREKSDTTNQLITKMNQLNIASTIEWKINMELNLNSVDLCV
jgi:hypothetical protein